MKKKLLSVLMSVAMTATLICPVFAAEDVEAVDEVGIDEESEAIEASGAENIEIYVEDSAVAANIGTEAMADAPELQLGTAYTYDVNGKYNADLSIPVKYKIVYFKYNVPEDGFYNIRFKSAASTEVDTYLNKGDGYKVAGIQSAVNKAFEKNEVSLSAGVHYVSIYVHGDDAYGSIYVGARGNKIPDPEYNTEQTVNHNTQKGIKDTLDMGFAQRLELGETYTYDFRQKYEANLWLNEKYKTGYYKYIVPKDGFYDVRFKSASDCEVDIHLKDANGSDKVAKNYLHNTGFVQLGTALSPGIYYIAIYSHGENAYGTVYFGERGTSMVDVEYDLNQTIHSGTEKGVKGSADMGFAPRLELDETYTYDFKQKYESNLSIGEVYKTYFFKYIVKENGVYAVNFSSTTDKEADVRLKDANGVNIAGVDHMVNKAFEKNDLVLSPGVYYAAIYLHNEDCRGAISVKKVGNAPADNDKDKNKDSSKPEEHTVTYDGVEELSQSVALPQSFTWSAKMKPIKLPSKKQMSRVGYTFVKWADKATGKKISAITKKNNADLNIVAVWKENKYKIKYKFVAPDSGFKASQKVNDKTAYGYESSVVTIMGTGVTAASTKSSEVYKLVGWSTIKGANTPMYKVGETGLKKLAGDTAKNKKLTLYPVWTK